MHMCIHLTHVRGNIFRKFNNTSAMPTATGSLPTTKARPPFKRCLLVNQNDNSVPAPHAFVGLLDPRLPICLRRLAKAKGFPTLTEVQKRCWSACMSGRDVIVKADTASGKTFGFLGPLLAVGLATRSVDTYKVPAPFALIIAPARELVVQIKRECGAIFRRKFGIHIATAYGGTDAGKQLQKMCVKSRQTMPSGAKHPQQQKTATVMPFVLVATPGRLLALVHGRQLSLQAVTHWVLDEADRLLQMGLQEQIQEIGELIRPDRVTFVFSATYTKTTKTKFKSLFAAAKSAIFIDCRDAPSHTQSSAQDTPASSSLATSGCAAIDQTHAAPPEDFAATLGLDFLHVSANVSQDVQLASDHKKPRKLIKLVARIREASKGQRQRPNVLIFCNKIKTVNFVVPFLQKNLPSSNKRENVAAMHGDLPQRRRELVLNAFRAGKVSILVATDVLGRGLDVKNLQFVINYDFPPSLQQYVHRIGRCGRRRPSKKKAAPAQTTPGQSFSFFTRNMACMAPSVVKLLRRCGQKVDRYMLQLSNEQSAKSNHRDTDSGDSMSEFDAGPAPDDGEDFFPDSDENEYTLSDKKRIT